MLRLSTLLLPIFFANTPELSSFSPFCRGLAPHCGFAKESPRREPAAPSGFALYSVQCANGGEDTNEALPQIISGLVWSSLFVNKRANGEEGRNFLLSGCEVTAADSHWSLGNEKGRETNGTQSRRPPPLPSLYPILPG